MCVVVTGKSKNTTTTKMLVIWKKKFNWNFAAPQNKMQISIPILFSFFSNHNLYWTEFSPWNWGLFNAFLPHAQPVCLPACQISAAASFMRRVVYWQRRSSLVVVDRTFMIKRGFDFCFVLGVPFTTKIQKKNAINTADRSFCTSSCRPSTQPSIVLHFAYSFCCIVGHRCPFPL